MARRIRPEEAVEIGLRMRQARMAQGLTLEQLAVSCGGDHSRISKIERGQFARLSPYVQSLCTAMNIDPESPDGGTPQALHARLDRLIREKPGAAAALQAVFDALDRFAN
jgi:transcriptional regulator with XRE-family HTH domain